MTDSSPTRWPAVPYEPWADTCAALHLWCQILGKYRLAHTPWVNHSWHATLYVTPRGFSTGTVPDPETGPVTLELDVHDRLLVASAAGGARETAPLEPMSVADFLGRARRVVEGVGGRFDIHGRPNELPDPIVAFAEDDAPRPCDIEAIRRFHEACARAERVFCRFRTAYLGKVSPVHLFWGSFDLAVTRFSGRTAPPHPGGIPNLPDAVTREAYSHEVSSAGFWPGNGGAGEATFYSYCYPTPETFRDGPVEPAAARWDETLGEFLLPYEAVRAASDPEATLWAFLESTYLAAAHAGGWDREALECAPGVPRAPRAVDGNEPA